MRLHGQKSKIKVGFFTRTGLKEKNKIEKDFEDWKFIWKTKQYYKELYECRNKYFNHIPKCDENVRHFEKIVEIYDESIRNCQDIDENEYVKIIKILLHPFFIK